MEGILKIATFKEILHLKMEFYFEINVNFKQKKLIPLTSVNVNITEKLVF